MSGNEGLYSRVSRRKWNDKRYMALSRPQPNGQTLFDRLLSGPELKSIPGLFQAWGAGLAQALGWSMEGFREPFREVLREGLAKHDESTGLWWLPNAIHHNPPTSPNVIRGWRTTWLELPECALRDEAQQAISEWVSAMGGDWETAWFEVLGLVPEAARKPLGKGSAKGSGKGCPKGFGNGSPNQEQEQEQEQERDLREGQRNNPQRPTPEPEQPGFNETVAPTPSPESSGHDSGAVAGANSSDQDNPATTPADQVPKARQRGSQGANPKRWTMVPKNWAPNFDHEGLAYSLRVDMRTEEAKFRDHEFKAPRSDADAAFRAWLRRAAEFAPKRPTKNQQDRFDPMAYVRELRQKELEEGAAL